jgi:acetolactate synthase small subunit
VLEPCGILEMVRTGAIAMTRGAEPPRAVEAA